MASPAADFEERRETANAILDKIKEILDGGDYGAASHDAGDIMKLAMAFQKVENPSV